MGRSTVGISFIKSILSIAWMAMLNCSLLYPTRGVAVSWNSRSQWNISRNNCKSFRDPNGKRVPVDITWRRTLFWMPKRKQVLHIIKSLNCFARISDHFHWISIVAVVYFIYIRLNIFSFQSDFLLQHMLNSQYLKLRDKFIHLKCSLIFPALPRQ
jgi:hypothetical protein